MSTSPIVQVALVTGAAAGLGEAYALRLARDGFAVAVLDAADASEVIQCIRDTGGRAEAWVCDVANWSQVEASVDAVISNFGRVDVLVNNAGIYPSTPGIGSLAIEQWNEVLSVNLNGTFHLCRAVAPIMRVQRHGHIINVASAACWMDVKATPYIASKMGVVGLTRSLATELGDANVTVNCIAPGHVLTPGTRTERFVAMAPQLMARQALKRTAVPEDIAGVVAFLASEDANFVTGQTLLVDGGLARL
jgi:NAD(P)-dependent dehydrogenase (short-subunit alcohol dehydrogenase family)